MAITIVQEQPPYRLIGDGGGRYAVIEARGGRVYSLHPRRRRGAEDTPEGMARVVREGWCGGSTARRRFRSMVRNEERYARIIW